MGAWVNPFKSLRKSHVLQTFLLSIITQPSKWCRYNVILPC